MTAWTRNEDIKKRLTKKWAKGEFLIASISPEKFEPLRIPLKHPTAGQLAHEFDAARKWVAQLQHSAGKNDKAHFTIEYREINHRTLGKNKIPKAVIFQTLEDILSYLGKTQEAMRFRKLSNKITDQYPELGPLVIEKTLMVLEHENNWDKFLSIISYMKVNPRPGIYIRQLEIPGVDTKFIEGHRSWIAKLLDLALSIEAIDQNAKGVGAFEKRFGFRSKPVRIRFRILDPTLDPTGLSDLEIREEDFRRFPIDPDIIFIVENEITCLSFPPVPGAIVIFGRGYALSALSQTPWMMDKPIWYWGDLDTNGFAMLDQIRNYFPQTRSFLMDEATLMTHRTFWGREPSQKTHNLPLLTPDETKVYDGLRRKKYAANLRLEQERINFSYIRKAILNIFY